MPDVLQLNRLTKDFGGLRAVDSVSFFVGEGEIVGLIGPNGAGKTTPSRARSRRAEYLQRVYEIFPPIAARRQQDAGTLSSGEQQMLAIGRALMSDPLLLLLDEPSLGLAPLVVRDVFGVIAQIRRQGVTVLLVEQNVRLALSIADRAYVLENGRIVLEGSGQDLLHHEDVRRAYLGV